MTALMYAGLEEAVNRCLELDPKARERLARLHGQVVAFELNGVGQTLFLVPGPGRIQLLASYEGEPDCRLRGTPLALARMGHPRAGSEQLFSGDVEISGDTELAHQIGRILGDLDIDWEEQLSHLTGDLVAHHTGNLLRDAGRWGRSSFRSLGLDIQEYLQEELRLLPVRTEIESFLGDVDRLRDDLERAEARLERLRTLSGGSR